MDTATLLQRFLEAGGAVLHSAMRVRALPEMGGGFGVTAEKTIAPGTLLARIPRPFMITASSARKYIISCGGSSSGPSLSPSNTIISFLLLAALRHGRFGAAHGSGGTSDSAWLRHWILSLPSRYDNLLELRELSGEVATDAFLCSSLRFARHREKVIHEQQRVTQEFHICQSALPSLLGWATLDQFLWAYNTLMSRGFAYEPEVWTLMPWVDYFNYAREDNATMSFDAQQGAYVFKSTRMIRRGEQIFLHYGSYTDMELLLWYGFTLTPQLLPQLFCGAVDAKDRADVLRRFLLHIKGGAHSGECEEHEKGPRGDGVWRRALQHALGHCFSPLEEADGSCPPHSPRGAWLGTLMAQFMALQPEENNPSHCATATDTVTTAIVAIASRVAESLTRNGAVSQHVGASDCRVGAMAPSAEMQKLLRHISLSASVSMTDALRAVCWAELQCNGNSTAEPHEGMTEVAAVARQASADAAALLWFLSVDATEEELALYISRDEDEI